MSCVCQRARAAPWHERAHAGGREKSTCSPSGGWPAAQATLRGTTVGGRRTAAARCATVRADLVEQLHESMALAVLHKICRCGPHVTRALTTHSTTVACVRGNLAGQRHFTGHAPLDSTLAACEILSVTAIARAMHTACSRANTATSRHAAPCTEGHGRLWRCVP